ncbi:MAG: OadG family transporter subunit [Actinomycetales bacterium]
MRAQALLAAASSQDYSTGDAIELVVTGLVVVVVALSVIALSCSAIGWAVRKLTPDASQATRTAPSAGGASAGDAVAAGAGERDIDDETIAVIAAAVATVLGKPHRIIRVRSAISDDTAWALHGRLQHHSSHYLPLRETS